MNNLTVSIGILNYNYNQYLPEAIECAKNQTYKVDQILVVDNGSMVKPEMVSGVDYYFMEKNQHIHGGRNAVFRCAESSYVYMLDADDLIKPETIEVLLEIKNESSLYTDIIIPNCLSQFNLETLKYNNPYPYSALIAKSAWLWCGGYERVEDNTIEDWDFWIKCAEQEAFRITTTPYELYIHRWHDNNTSRELADPIIFSKAKNALLRKHGYATI